MKNIFIHELRGNRVPYSSYSAMIDMEGNELFYEKDAAYIETIALKYSDLKEFRAKFPAYMDADQFQLLG